MVRTATLLPVTLQELAVELEISKDALKRRLGLMRTLGVDGAHRDAHGALVLAPETIALLRRSLELERQGFPMREAVRRALLEAHEEAPSARPPAPEDQTGALKDDVRPAVRTGGDPYLAALWTAIGILAVLGAGALGLAFLAVLRR